MINKELTGRGSFSLPLFLINLEEDL